MSMVELGEKYLEQINVNVTDFVPVNDAAVDCDAANLVLEIPRAMLREYSRIKNGTNKYPNPEEFWRETGLVDLLKGSGKPVGCSPWAGGTVHLDDVLEYLKGSDLFVKYERSSNPKAKCLDVFEKLPLLPTE